LSEVGYPAGPFAGPVARGDFNGDGRLDLAVIATGSIAPAFPPPLSPLLIYLGLGDGRFPLSQTLSSKASTFSGSVTMLAADLNGDGRDDLALGRELYLAQTDGKLARVPPPPSSPPPTPAQAFQDPGLLTAALPGLVQAVGDFNGDGLADVLVAKNKSLVVGLSRGDSTFLVGQTLAAAGSVKVGDFNGDKKLDLAILDMTANQITIWLGNGAGGFQLQAATLPLQG